MRYETGKKPSPEWGGRHYSPGCSEQRERSPGMQKGTYVPPRGGKFVEGNAMIRGVVDEF